MRIAPFRAWCFNGAKVGPVEDVLAPPEDEITPALRDELYKRSPFNVVRLLDPIAADDDPGSRPRIARATFDAWMREDVLRREPGPSIYPYQQSFAAPQGMLSRIGFIALGEVTEFAAGAIRRRESALVAPREERVRLMQETRGDFSLVMVLYNDPQMRVEGLLRSIVATPPRLEVEDARRDTHRLWRVGEPSIVGGVMEILAPLSGMLAQGEERYEAALEFRRRFEGKLTFAGTKVMAFFNSAAPGVLAMPLHRLVPRLGSTPESFLEQAASRFAVQPVFGMGRLTAALAAAPENSFGFYGRDAAALLTWRGDSGAPPWSAASEAHSAQWKSLDVPLFEAAVFGGLLGIEATRDEGERWTCAASVAEVAAAVDSGAMEAGFVLRAPSLAALEHVVAAGEPMPPGSTIFPPSLLSGLAINKLDEA